MQTFHAIAGGIAKLVRQQATSGSNDPALNKLLHHFTMDLTIMGIVFYNFSTQRLMRNLMEQPPDLPGRSQTVLWSLVQVC